MTKTIKVIDLLNKIANEEEVPIVKFKLNQHRFKYNKKDKMFDDIDDFSRCKCYIEFCELDDELEIIEEQQDIDIQDIEELAKIIDYAELNTYPIIDNNREKINKLIQAVKQLDRNIKDKE